MQIESALIGECSMVYMLGSDKFITANSVSRIFIRPILYQVKKNEKIIRRTILETKC